MRFCIYKKKSEMAKGKSLVISKRAKAGYWSSVKSLYWKAFLLSFTFLKFIFKSETSSIVIDTETKSEEINWSLGISHLK